MTALRARHVIRSVDSRVLIHIAANSVVRNERVLENIAIDGHSQLDDSFVPA